jgi:hypothetical protein
MLREIQESHIPYWFDPRGEATSVEIGEEFAEHLISGLLHHTKRAHRARG